VRASHPLSRSQEKREHAHVASYLVYPYKVSAMRSMAWSISDLHFSVHLR
jgi:hypothetical protein